MTTERGVTYYTEQQHIDLRQKPIRPADETGVTYEHLSIGSQWKCLMVAYQRLKSARAALAPTDAARATLGLAWAALRIQFADLEHSAALQSATERHLRDAGGYAVINEGWLHRVEPIPRLTTLARLILRHHAPELEEIWWECARRQDAHIVRALAALPDNAEYRRRRQCGLRQLSERQAALPAEEWSAIAAEHEVSVITVKRRRDEGESLVVTVLGESVADARRHLEEIAEELEGEEAA